MKNFIKALSSPIFMTFLIVLLIIAMATATFIENDYGTQVARMKIYNAFWFEFVLFMLAVNLTLRIVDLRLYKPAKFSIFLFHIAFVIMIIGGAITRYTGIEGSMHIREGAASSKVVTFEKQVTVTLKNESDSVTKYFSSYIDNRRPFSEKVGFDNKKFNIELTRFYQSAVPHAMQHPQGSPVIGYVLAGNNLRGFHYIGDGEINIFQNISIAFNNESLADINISSRNDSVFIESRHAVSISSMGSEEITVLNEPFIHAEPRKIYQVLGYNFVLQEFFPSAIITAAPTSHDNHASGLRALIFNISDKQNNTNITLWENLWDNQAVYSSAGNTQVGIAYGNKEIDLPFSLHLDSFVIERYPGSMSPSSFSSFVQILENGKEQVPYHIFMNNILKMHGYRFFQSSYDQDERGTILSVNHDPWGTGITYLSYFLLVVGMLWSLINPTSYFRRTVVKDKSFALVLIFLFALSGTGFAQNPPPVPYPVDKKHAEEFSKLLIQNNRGRTEPLHTFASAITRKLSRKESIHGLSPAQLFLEMNIDPQLWVEVPLIRIKNNELKQMLGITGNYAAYMDFISHDRSYLLHHYVHTAFAKPPAQRTRFDKAVIQTDEKVNISYGIFTGDYLRIFPIPDTPGYYNWYTAHDASKVALSKNDSIYFDSVLSNYFDAIVLGKNTGDYSKAYSYLEEMHQHQREHAGYKLPSRTKVNIEVVYNKLNTFKKLLPYYMLFGMVQLIALIVFITIGKKTPVWILRSFFYLIFVGFTMHTLGIAARWYISGYAPMSNGYETLVFIAWVTVLAGFIFNKRSPFSLPATTVMAGLSLMVANLNFMDPVITNLVPVLQSYWLTIHVSVITAGYAFLALGAILGIINLVLVILRKQNNHNKISETILELTSINHKSLIIGLYFLTIGSFLGAVWANESWGRYWGWDPKETWALISILVYMLVTHMRLIPGLKGVFIFNTFALWGFSSIIMTYFGVNYYLSGLHSYAGGDSVPIPTFVYYTVFAFIVLTATAWYNYSKFKVNAVSEEVQD